MPDRADYLARTFITRARALETLAADGDVVDPLALSRRLEDMVAKVLAVEVGVVDGGAVQRMAGALPHVRGSEPTSKRDMQELAAFIRAHFGAFL